MSAHQKPSYFESIINSFPGYIYFASTDGKYIISNENYAKILNLNSAKELIGKKINDFFEDKYAKIINENDQKVIMSKVERWVEEKFAVGSEKENTLFFQKNCVFNKYGKIIGLFAISYHPHNLDEELERTKSEKEYFVSLVSYLEKIINLLPGHVYWKDNLGFYQGCNGAMAKILNLTSSSEIIGKTIFELVPEHKELAEKTFREDQQIIKSNKEKSFEEYGLNSEGNPAVFMTKKSLLHDEQGKVLGLIGLSLDITRRKKSEEALKLAKEKAEAANHAKTEFLENMRHDLRTPLTGMIGCAQLIRQQANHPIKVREYAEDLVHSTEALLDFLNRIIDGIEVATGEIRLQKKKFNAYQILNKIILLNKPQADIKKINFSFDYDPALPKYLLGDSNRLQRIALELITNALKFTNKGSVKLAVSLVRKQLKKEKIVLRLSVSDTGIGIPYDKQHEVYTRFKRLTPSYQGLYPGTGLGLSIVKQFVDDLEGEIQLKSQLNQGSTFTCFLPFTESLDLDSEPNEQTASDLNHNAILEKQAEALSCKTGYILLVEDNNIASKIAKEILSELGCQVDIATDGEQALTYLEVKHYDLILMDVGLPDGDGCEITRRIRLQQWQRNPFFSIPIIGLTAHISPEAKKRCLNKGMNAIYFKPLTRENITVILNTFLSQSQNNYYAFGSLGLIDLQAIPLLNTQQALELAGNKKVLDEVFALLLKSLEQATQILQQYYQTKAWHKIRDWAHKLMVNASYCGASRLEKACQQLENALQAELSGLDDYYEQLLETIQATKEVVEKERLSF